MVVLILCVCMVGLILFPAQGVEGALEGLRLCGGTLIPTLFPFFFLTGFLGQCLPAIGRKCGCLGISPQAFTGLLMSFVGGYPTGVVTVTSLYKSGKIKKEEAENLIPVCNNSGPGFFIGVLGMTVMGEPRKGLCLYLIHVCSAVMILMLRGKRNGAGVLYSRTEERKSFPQLFQQVLGNSCETMIRVCGLVILFSVFQKLVIPLIPGAYRRYWGFVELSSGLGNTGPEDFVLWAVMMGWGGLCVHLQAMSIWQDAGLHIQGYFAAKAFHGILSGVMAVAVCYRKWVILPILIGSSVVFMEIRKKWGSQKQNLAV